MGAISFVKVSSPEVGGGFWLFSLCWCASRYDRRHNRQAPPPTSGKRPSRKILRPSSAELSGVPSHGRRRPDVARHVRRSETVAKAMKMRTGLRSQRGAMPPFFLEKTSGSRNSSTTSLSVKRRSAGLGVADGGHHEATRPTCRSPSVRHDRQVDDRGTGSRSEVEGRHSPLLSGPTGGRLWARADGAHRRSAVSALESERSTTSQERRHQKRRRTVRVSPHDYSSVVQGEGASAGAAEESSAAGPFTKSAQRGYLSA